jgi:hypothetical protein
MKQSNTETPEVKTPSRRRFIKSGLMAGGAILGSLTLLNSCDIVDSLTKLQSSKTLPTKISRIENLPEVTAALGIEKQQISSLSVDLRQFQVDMNDLDSTLTLIGRANSMNTLSEENSFKLQKLMEKRNQMEAILSNVLKAFEDTQKLLVANLK